MNPRVVNRRVVVVGGGIAGIAASMAIAETMPDIRVTLCEARRTSGGRAGSFVDPTTNETVDYCQHVAMGCCTNLLDLLHRFDMSDEFTRYQSLTFYHPEYGMSSFAPNLRMPAPLHLHKALAGLRYLRLQERTRLAWAITKLMRQRERTLEKVTAATWLDRHRQSSRLRVRFWDVVLVSALGDVPERVSMAAARKVIVDGFAAAHGASDVWVPNRPLSQIFGNSMLDHLARHGVEVKTGCLVRSLRYDERDEEVELICGDDGTLRSDHVVLATAWRSASKLIETIEPGLNPSARSWQDATVSFLSSVKSSPITGLHLWFDREITPLPHVAMVGTVSHWLFKQPLRQSTSDRAGDQAGVYHQVVISGPHRFSESSKDALLSAVCDELAKAFPIPFSGPNPAKLLHHRIVTDPNAVYSVTPQFQAHRPATTTTLAWLSLAGDYVDTGWPATMEGAAISGRLAAEAVGDRFGRRVHCVTPPLSPGRLARWLMT
ncbi:hydroxysqualene dehydroxylase HpnE [Neorhodopirellula pilleata]|uniref:15-cis-phytoene desaturase n=1 Tax=Neorhodopirellula pilleata TaxID=2714738 RepID=A0A5C6ARP0_9BACT|nr:hydroxysqualene dehydroxylase HpnE [Neorhodopirellula pilleata]TWU01622.1 15-cis-phytoene desaturase [Neorhodopirellula pilleata]